MQKLIVNLFFLLFSLSIWAQLDPVHWTTSVVNTSDKDVFILQLTAHIDGGWHLYAQTKYPDAEIAPTPTEFIFDQTNGGFHLLGTTQEPLGYQKMDAIFGLKIKYFENQAIFQQKIKRTSSSLDELEASVFYVVCDDTRCLAPEEKFFKFDLPSAKVAMTSKSKASITKKPLVKPIKKPIGKPKNTKPEKPKLAFQTQTPSLNFSTQALVPTEKKKPVSKVVKKVNGKKNKHQVVNKHSSFDSSSFSRSFLEGFKLKNKSEFLANPIHEKGLWWVLVMGFLGGLLALLTPCVFPMIPLTVSFFTKSNTTAVKGKINAMWYGFFIVFTYILLSIPFHVLDSINPDILNQISTNIYVNLFFFTVFVVFALSFFGYFDIQLPSSWGRSMDDKANKAGGILGIFFMAFTLCLVSFSCTGPILGSLLGSSLSSDGGAMALSMGMAGFGFALALPFTLFAWFPSLLNSLPRSGGWLQTVKVVIGFVELALSLKFLSNADLVSHWGILPRELFLGAWILLTFLLIIYLLGGLQFLPYAIPKRTKISLSRRLFVFMWLGFVMYLISGILPDHRNPLSSLSGILPPHHYSFYKQEDHSKDKLVIYDNLQQALQEAKDQSKPLLIDFTGLACVNCRKMEDQVWTQSTVKNLLSKYIIASLHVDDRKPLPEAKRFKFQMPNGSQKNIRSVGSYWSAFQTVHFNDNSQPYYVLMDSDLNLLASTRGYTPSVSVYAGWLEDGLKRFARD